ncbi:hypothetical protein VKT23_012230 [Stygiomarasmius scandens]|uniref:Uncharacterized protein n=1 Tax=Marasmiellus scandens TaxID=2682957 RepID=A0ABR1J6T8_9AGAR
MLPPIPSNIGDLYVYAQPWSPYIVDLKQKLYRTGPLLIGVNLNWGLLGITVVQIYMYHVLFPNDSRFVKSLVYALGALDLLSSVLLMIDTYHWFGAGFGNITLLSDPDLGPIAGPFLDGVLALMVQLFYSYRVWILKRSVWLPIVITMSSLLSAGAAMAAAIQQYVTKLETSAHRPSVSTPLWFASSLLSDALIAIVMIQTLINSSTNIPATKKIITRIIYLVFGTNLMTGKMP